MDNSSDGEDFEPNAAQPNDSNNPQLEYGPSNFNIPQRFTWNFAYELPMMGGACKVEKWMGHQQRADFAGWPALPVELQL